MNFRITFTFFMLVLCAFNVHAQLLWGGPGDPNSEFANGLNDWTVVAVSSLDPDSTENALWEWDEDSTPNKGAYGTTQTALESPSAANGAAYFDSDFLDNGGVQDSFGTGPAPSPQVSDLISPMIDLTGEPLVAVTFYQKLRKFNASPTLNVSADGGMTYTPFAVSPGLPDGTTLTDPFTTIDISSVAGDQDSVVLKFTWDGDYYFWMIDDVAIIVLPGTDLSINEVGTFYSPLSAVQPACTMDQDTILFQTQISNIGGDTITNIVYKASVFNNDTGELIYSDSVSIESLPIGFADSTVSIVELWDPPLLDQGVYIIQHTVYSEDEMDFDDGNNTVNQFFEVNDMAFAKDSGGQGSYGWWNDGGFNAYGVMYLLGNECMETYTIGGVQYSVGRVGVDTEPLVGREMQFWLWKMNSNSLADFDFTQDYIETTTTLQHNSMEFVAFAPDAIDEEDTGAIFTSDAPFLSADADEINPILEPGVKYGLFAHWGINGTTSPLHLMNNDNAANDFMFYVEGDGRFYTGFSNNLTCPILRMQLELVSSVDERPLSDQEFKAYPNPAVDLLNLEMNLESASNATITIADVTGKVISYRNLQSVQQEIITLNIADYVAGTYLARIATDKGTKTLKFVVGK